MKEHYKGQFELPMKPFGCGFHSMMGFIKNNKGSSIKQAIILIHLNKWRLENSKGIGAVEGLYIAGFKNNPIHNDMMRIRKELRKTTFKAIKKTMENIDYERW